MIVRETLPNGIRAVVESVPGVRSVACGVWVDVGSRDEGPDTFGASHFLEHLLFKGTERWSALEIAQRLDAVGGEFNAFTGKENTAYYVRTLDEDIGLGLDILADITQRPAFRTDEVDAERNVVLEEINMYEDSPDELVHDNFGALILDGHPLGRQILGSRESITSMSRDTVAGYFAANYTPGRTVVSVAGNVDAGRFVDEIASRWDETGETAPPRTSLAIAHEPHSAVQTRQTEQAHIVLGVPTVARDDPRRDALSLLNQLFGGGMSSRLFQEVREKRGLVYSVYSYRSLFIETGYFAAYAGTAPHRADETLDVLRHELDVLGKGVTEDEVTAAKSHLRGALALSQEDTGSRMSRIGRTELTLGRVETVDEVVDRLEAVTLDEVNEMAAELAAAPRTLAMIAPFDDSGVASLQTETVA